METWIALLRGINVGGHNPLPMESLREVLTSAGGQQVATYIQSGNAVFRADIESRDSFAADVASAIDSKHGFAPTVRLLSADELDAAVRCNPYPDATSEPASLHLYFLDNPPSAEQLARVDSLATATELFEVNGSHLYLHAPDGVARSKLVKGLDRALGMNATARNWRTVLKIAGLANTIR